MAKKISIFKCFNECIARGETDKIPFGKYALPCAHLELAYYYTDTLKDYNQAKIFLNKSQSGFKDYELENRIQTQIKSLQRRLKFIVDAQKLEASQKAKLEAEQQLKLQKENQIKNFYVQ